MTIRNDSLCWPKCRVNHTFLIQDRFQPIYTWCHKKKYGFIVMHIDYSLFIKLAFNEGCNYDVDSLYYSLSFFAKYVTAFRHFRHRLSSFDYWSYQSHQVIEEGHCILADSFQ